MIAQVGCAKRITADRRRKSAGPLPRIDRVRDVRTLANSAGIYKVSNSAYSDNSAGPAPIPAAATVIDFSADLKPISAEREFRESKMFINVLELSENTNDRN